MLYNLSFINYVGGQWITTDLKEDIMATKNQTEEIQRMTTHLNTDIMPKNVNQTDEMQKVITDLKRDIMATKNQAGKMQKMTTDLKEDIMAMKTEAGKMKEVFAGLKQDIVAAKNQAEAWLRMPTRPRRSPN